MTPPVLSASIELLMSNVVVFGPLLNIGVVAMDLLMLRLPPVAKIATLSLIPKCAVTSPAIVTTTPPGVIVKW
jgi:hypothetical protein